MLNNNTKTNKNFKRNGKNNSPRRIEAPKDVNAICEYKMPTLLAENILKEDKSKRDPQEILCEYVNTHCGLKTYCVRVTYF